MSGDRVRWQAMGQLELNLRDTIAAGVLNSMISGLLSSSPNALANIDVDKLAVVAYMAADAMMKARRQ